MNRATFDYRCAVPTINIFRVYWNSRRQRIFSTQFFSVLDRLIYKDFNANHLAYIVPRWYSSRIYADCLQKLILLEHDTGGRILLVTFLVEEKR